MTNFYHLLKLEPTATLDEIKAAYARERASRIAQGSEGNLHINGDLQALDEAYATLIEPSSRAAYDRMHSSAPTTTMIALPGQLALSTISVGRPLPIVQQPCPACGVPNPIQAVMCTVCGRQMTRPCPKCGRAVMLSETVCPRCETFIPEYDQRRFAEAQTVKQQVEFERREADEHTTAADKVYQAQIRMGMLFWVVVTGLCIGLAVLGIVLLNYLNR